MNKKLSGWTLIFLIASRVCAQDAGSEGLGSFRVEWDQLRDLVQKAPETEAALANATAAKHRTGYLWRSFQPRIDAGLFADGETFLNGGNSFLQGIASYRQNIIRFSRDENKSRAFDLLAQAKRLEAIQTKADVLFLARSAWLEVWVAREKGELLASLKEQTERNIQRGKKKERAGLTSQSDLHKFELFLMEINREIAETQNSQEEGAALLAGMLGISTNNLELGDGFTSWPGIEKADDAKGLPALFIRLKSDSLLSDGKSLGAWPFPSLDLQAQWVRGGPIPALRDNETFVGLELSASLWDQGQAESESNALREEAKALSKEADGLAVQWVSQIRLAHSQILRWNGQNQEAETRIGLAERFQQKVSEEYILGVKDSVDLQEATKELFQAKLIQVETQAKAWESWSRLKSLLASDFEQENPSGTNVK